VYGRLVQGESVQPNEITIVTRDLSDRKMLEELLERPTTTDALTGVRNRCGFPDKIRELARKGEAWGDSESRQMLEHAIETGRGGVYLRLTPDQYRKVRRP
jgi:hypothetical protein